LNVNDHDCSGERLPLSNDTGPLVDVVVWAVPSKFFQVTLVPTLTVIDDGLKAPPCIFTFPGAGPWP